MTTASDRLSKLLGIDPEQAAELLREGTLDATPALSGAHMALVLTSSPARFRSPWIEAQPAGDDAWSVRLRRSSAERVDVSHNDRWEQIPLDEHGYLRIPRAWLSDGLIVDHPEEGTGIFLAATPDQDENLAEVVLATIPLPAVPWDDWQELAWGDDVADLLLDRVRPGSPASVLRTIALVWRYGIDTAGTAAERLERAKTGQRTPLVNAIERWVDETTDREPTRREVVALVRAMSDTLVDALESLESVADGAADTIRTCWREIVLLRDDLDALLALLHGRVSELPSLDEADALGMALADQLDRAAIDGVPDATHGRWMRSLIEHGEDAWWLRGVR